MNTIACPQHTPMYAVWRTRDGGVATGLVVGWELVAVANDRSAEYWPVTMSYGGQFNNELCGPARRLPPEMAVDMFFNVEDAEEAREIIVAADNEDRRNR